MEVIAQADQSGGTPYAHGEEVLHPSGRSSSRRGSKGSSLKSMG